MTTDRFRRYGRGTDRPGTHEEAVRLLRRERWRVSGYAGEHEEGGAQVLDQDGQAVLHTAGGLGYHTPPSSWLRYRATAHLASMAPELLDCLAAVLAGDPGAESRAEDALRRATEF